MRARTRSVAMLVLAAACSGRDSADADPARSAAAAAARADSVATAATPAPGTPPAGTSADDLARGRTTYATVCAVCHGPDARGTQLGPGIANAPDSARTASLDSVVALVRGGVPDGDPIAMPAYAGELDDTAIRAVSAYVVALRRR